MNRILFFCLLLCANPCWAALNVFATVPEWAALAREIGGDQVMVYAATHALQDPHRVEAKPSLLARARQAQLVIATGADLEIGWLPLVLRDSGNAAIQPGQPGYFEAASVISRIEVPAMVDRAQGDVHPGGNPHFQLDPYRVLKIAQALGQRLGQLDPAHAEIYRENTRRFSEKWQAAIARWEQMARPLRGVPVVVQHTSFSYLLGWLGMPVVGTLEPKPGVEPSSGDLAQLLQRLQQTPARMILRASYQSDGPSTWLAEKAKLPMAVLPFTVGGSPEARDLFGLFEDSIQRLLKGLQA